MAVHVVPVAGHICPCSTLMVEIGQNIGEQIDIVQMQVRVVHNIRKRYGCPQSSYAPITAALSPQPLCRNRNLLRESWHRLRRF